MVQSAQKCRARATPDSSTRCSKKPGYLSAPFNSVVKHILILSPKLWDCSISHPSWLQRPYEVTNEYKSLRNEAQMKTAVLRTSKTAASKARHVFVCYVTKWQNSKTQIKFPRPCESITRQDKTRLHCRYSINLRNISAASQVHFFTRLILWLASSSPSRKGTIKNLGVQLHSKLHFHTRADQNFFHPVRLFGPIQTIALSLATLDSLCMLYLTMLRPKLQFASTVWNS
jgi:hypothetical protein